MVRGNLRAIAARLKRETDARIALISLPALGQEPESLPVRRAGGYSAVVKEAAAPTGSDYLPLYERQLNHHMTTGANPGIPFQDGRTLIGRAAVPHFVLQRSFDGIARRRGLELTTDFVHQNSRGATTIADLIGDYLGLPR